MANIGLITKNKRMVMLEDLISTRGNLVNNLAVEKDCICKNKPKNCPKCYYDTMIGVEVMGGYNGILFWECDKCDIAILRFRESVTEKYLQLAKGVWTNPRDWGYVSRSKFN